MCKRFGSGRWQNVATPGPHRGGTLGCFYFKNAIWKGVCAPACCKKEKKKTHTHTASLLKQFLLMYKRPQDGTCRFELAGKLFSPHCVCPHPNSSVKIVLMKT